MFRLDKRSIAKFIGSDCPRQLRLMLYAGTKSRASDNAPDKDQGRPGLAYIAEQGRQFEREKFAELIEAFDGAVLHGVPKARRVGEETAYNELRLDAAISKMSGTCHEFLIEAQFDANTAPFLTAFDLATFADGFAFSSGQGVTLAFSQVRPDIIHAIPCAGQRRRVVQPDRSIVEVDAEDARIGLRIIDIKVSGEPSPSHFVELAYYAVTLASWLRANGMANRFVVLSDAAIWPGSHEASNIRAIVKKAQADGLGHPSSLQLLEAFDKDLETLPAEAVLGRLNEFLRRELPKVLLDPDWRALDWHVDGGCRSCDFLGYDWTSHVEGADDRKREPKDARYCWPQAEREGNLSRIAGLTRGACGILREHDVNDVLAMAQYPAGKVLFEKHQKLRERRTVLPARALLMSGQGATCIPDGSGSSAVMPSFADFNVDLSVDFDIGSGLTFAIGYSIEAIMPVAIEQRGTAGSASRRSFTKRALSKEAAAAFQMTSILLVERKDIGQERTVVGKLLDDMMTTLALLRDRFTGEAHRLIEEATKPGAMPGIPDEDLKRLRIGSEPTFQVYLWDKANYRHLQRLTGRHLLTIDGKTLGKKSRGTAPTVPAVWPLAWMFPSDKVVEDPDFVARTGPLTILKEVIDPLLAAPVPHAYGLYALANSYYDNAYWDAPEQIAKRNGRRNPFHLNWRFHDPLSDQIPSERGHEMWAGAAPIPGLNFQQYRDELRKAVRARLAMMQSIRRKLRGDLQEHLKTFAPSLSDIVDSSGSIAKAPPDSQIFYRHSLMLARQQSLETDILMATPPHVREARFESIRLEKRIEGAERRTRLTGLGLPDVATTWVFSVSKRSLQAKLDEGDFSLSLVPEDCFDLAGLKVWDIKKKSPGVAHECDPRMREYETVRNAAKCAILAFDRTNAVIALTVDPFVGLLEKHGQFRFATNPTSGVCAIIDPVTVDFFVRPRLHKALEAIRVPPLSLSSPLFGPKPLIRVKMPNVKATDDVPCAGFLWDAKALSSESSVRDITSIRRIAGARTPALTEKQMEAVTTAAGRHLSLIWGPPGSGKSATATALITSLVGEARQNGRTLRVAITGPTWVAIDTVAKKVATELNAEIAAGQIAFHRLVSSTTDDARVPDELKPYVASDAYQLQQIHEALKASKGIVIVASTANQIGRLCDVEWKNQDGSKVKKSDRHVQELFDYVLVDEASQMTVAQAVVVFAALAEGASVAVVGDHLQMPPVQAVPPPEGCGHLLGSLYDFYHRYRTDRPSEIPPVMLDRSFRSNEAIVSFVREAGYGPTFKPIDANAGSLLNLSAPASTAKPAAWPLGNDDWGDHLAHLTDPTKPLAALIHDDPHSSQHSSGEVDLVAALVGALLGRICPDDGLVTGGPLSVEEAFRSGIGVVTPHRAQMAAIQDKLKVFAKTPAEHAAMRAAVDTVERFQGQERSVMIASFGLGDRDQIASEEEFLYSLNRFNVIASRAKRKLIVIASRQLVHHLPAEPEVLRGSFLLKRFCDGFLPVENALSIKGMCNAVLKTRS